MVTLIYQDIIDSQSLFEKSTELLTWGLLVGVILMISIAVARICKIYE